MSIKLYKLVYLYTRRKIKFCKVNVQRSLVPPQEFEHYSTIAMDLLKNKK